MYTILAFSLIITIALIAMMVLFAIHKFYQKTRVFQLLITEAKPFRALKYTLFGLMTASWFAWNMAGNPFSLHLIGLSWLEESVPSMEYLFGAIGFSALSIVMIFVGVYTFIKSKLFKQILVYFIFPLSLFSMGTFLQNIIMMRVPDISSIDFDFSIFSIYLVAIMTITSFLLSLIYSYQAIFENGKIRLPQLKGVLPIISFITFIIFMIFIALPPSVPQNIIGKTPDILLKDFGQGHRILLSAAVVIPFVLYFGLKYFDYNTRLFALLFIAYAGMVNIMSLGEYNWEMFGFLWGNPGALASWPFHLCNTAMFIIPLVLTFKLKKVFYFTYFINVFGAAIALLMPNIGGTQILGSSNLVFWQNHILAMAMPLLIVALGVYEKPHWRQFWYSIIGFAIYYLFVLIMNGWLTNYNSRVDFFFINSDYVISQLSGAFRVLRDAVLSFNIGNNTFTYYPLYQSLFFVVYIGISLGMWFVYINVFSFAHKLQLISIKNKMLKEERFQFLLKMNGKDETIPLYEGGLNMIKLEHFSKIYGKSPVYAVHDVSFEVNEGHVYGFLGPNGAGKSTIIKCLVGIQPLTSGTASVCGYDVMNQSREAKLNIGFVPDHYALYENLTGREYINFVADMYQVSRTDRTLRMNDFVQRFELTKAFDNQIRTYSHGMKQKIAIIAALIHAPKVWILDEPLTGLDPQSIFQVKETMREYARKGNIVFFSSHIMDVVERTCDSYAMIKFGQIIKSGLMSEIHESGKTLEEHYMEAISDPSIVQIKVNPDDSDDVSNDSKVVESK